MGLSIDALLQATVEDHRRAGDKLFWRLSKRHSLSIGLNVVAEGWPIVFLGQQFASFLDVKMAGQKIFVVTAN